MFQFVEKDGVRIEKTGEGWIEGTLTKPLSFYTREMQSKIGTLALHCTSLSAFFSYLAEQEGRTRPEFATSHKLGTDGGFRVLPSFPAALDIFQNRPWEVRKFEENDRDIKMRETSGTEIFYDVTGSYIDMGRFMEGVPEVWGTNIEGNPSNLFATIVINTNASGAIYSATLKRRAERVVRLVDWLERQNIRTEIVAFSSNETRHAEIVIKQAHDSLNLDSIAVVSHPDFHRRMIFRVAEYSRTWNAGYGSGGTVENQHMRAPKIEGHNITIYSENKYYESEINKVFDAAEVDIERQLEAGEKTFAVTC